MTPELNLAGKRVLITGGASGIGFATAKLLSRLDAKVLLMDLAGAGLAAVGEECGAVGTFEGDITNEAHCEAAVAKTIQACGGIDSLIHSAGVSDRVAYAVDVNIDEWQRIVDVTLRGTFLMCRAAARPMLTQRHGAIVTLSSVNGLNGFPRRSAYGPSKAAVAALTRNLACEWGAAGVRINAIAPSYILTPMVSRLVAQGKIDPEPLKARTPINRLGEPEEVAQAAAFLISDWATYVTGATLPVDGGWTAFGAAGEVQTA